MGVTHFISLGKSPGGATAAMLASVNERTNNNVDKFFVGSLGDAQDIVLFATHDLPNRW